MRINTLLLFILSLFINFYLGYNLYNQSKIFKSRLINLNKEYYEEVETIKKQLSYYDDATLANVFNELFTNATNIDCTANSPNSGELSQDTSKQITK